MIINVLEPKKESKDLKLEFYVKEYMGHEICDLNGNIITAKDGIKHGDKVLCWENMLTEVHMDASKPYGISGGIMHSFEYDIDDRHCWVSSCMINLACLARIEFV